MQLCSLCTVFLLFLVLIMRNRHITLVCGYLGALLNGDWATWLLIFVAAQLHDHAATWLHSYLSFSTPSCDHFGCHGKWKKYLVTNRLKEKLTLKLINNRTNTINSTSGGITRLSLFPSHCSETRHKCINLKQQSEELKICCSQHQPFV